jgi:hypothetical protein
MKTMARSPIEELQRQIANLGERVEQLLNKPVEPRTMLDVIGPETKLQHSVAIGDAADMASTFRCHMSNGIAAEKCSGDFRTMGREQFMPLSREQRGGWKTDRDSREGSRQTAGEMRGEAAVRLQNRTPRRFA